MRHPAFLAIMMIVLGLASAVAVAGPAGPEFRINSYRTQRQSDPAVARLAGGGFVAVWTSYRQDGSGDGVYGQRYGRNGLPAGGEFRVNSRTESQQRWAAVAGLSGGGFVVVWNSSGQDGSGEGVFGQRYTAGGVPAGAEFRVNSHTAGSQLGAAVAGLSGGGFVVAWTSSGQDDFDNGVFGQRYDYLGAPAGGELQIAVAPGFDQSSPSVAALPGNRFVVTWISRGQDGSGYGIYGRRFGAAGLPLSGEFRVNGITAGDQIEPSVAALADGGLVVAWADDGRDGSQYGVFARRFSAAGAPASGDFRVNNTSTASQLLPSAAATADGGFVVAWASYQSIDTGPDVYGRQYDGAGAPLGREFRINTYLPQSQTAPAVAGLANGGFIAAWTSLRADGGYYEIYGRRYD